MEPEIGKTHALHFEAKGPWRIAAAMLAVLGAFGLVVMILADVDKSLWFYMAWAIGVLGLIVLGRGAATGRFTLRSGEKIS